MIFFLSVLTALFCFWLALVTLDEKQIFKYRLLNRHGADDNGIRPKEVKSGVRLCAAVILAVLSAAAAYSSRGASDYIQMAKLLFAIPCVIGSGCVDLVTHRIPNIFPLSMAAGGALFLLIGCFTGQRGALTYVAESAFASVTCSIFLLIASRLSKNGIGMGDIKLLSALALLGGISILGGTIIFGMAACVIVCAFLLITKRKTLNNAIPFAPFVMLGFITALLLKKY